MLTAALHTHSVNEVVSNNKYTSLCDLSCVYFLLQYLLPSSCCSTRGPQQASFGLPAQLTCGKGEINSQFHFAAGLWQVLDRSGLGACWEQDRESELVWPSPLLQVHSVSCGHCTVDRAVKAQEHALLPSNLGYDDKWSSLLALCYQR